MALVKDWPCGLEPKAQQTNLTNQDADSNGSAWELALEPENQQTS